MTSLVGYFIQGIYFSFRRVGVSRRTQSLHFTHLCFIFAHNANFEDLCWIIKRIEEGKRLRIEVKCATAKKICWGSVCLCLSVVVGGLQHTAAEINRSWTAEWLLDPSRNRWSGESRVSHTIRNFGQQCNAMWDCIFCQILFWCMRQCPEWESVTKKKWRLNNRKMIMEMLWHLQMFFIFCRSAGDGSKLAIYSSRLYLQVIQTNTTRARV